jgi:hypothetical protein
MHRGFIVVEFGENMPTRLPNRNGPRRVGLRGDPLTEVEALAFLALWSGSGDAERLPALAREVAKERGNLPLALAMAGARVRDDPKVGQTCCIDWGRRPDEASRAVS